MRIAFYISNHGLGHAGRMSALISEFAKLQIRCYAMTDRPLNLFHGINTQFLFYRTCSLDFGVVQNNPLSINIEQSLDQLQKFYQNKDEIIDKESAFLKTEQIDLIIADIPPLAFEIAEKARIPIYAVSNFDWYNIYKALIPNNETYAWFKKAYQKADKSFILAFSGKKGDVCLPNQQYCGLLARKASNIRLKLQKELNIPHDHKIVLYALNDEIDFDLSMIFNIPKTTFISKAEYQHPAYRKINDNYYFPDLLASVDIVIAKSGYSTLAETVQSGVYLILCTRDENIEDSMILHDLKAYPQVKILPYREWKNFDWAEFLTNLNYERKTIPRFKNANRLIASEILKSFYDKKELKVVLDVGTNNVLMLWAEYQDAKLSVWHRANAVSALGKNMYDGLIRKSAIQRLKKIFNEFLPITLRVTSNITILATSCSREALNIKEIQTWLYKKYHLNYEIISAEKEAELNGYANLSEFQELDTYCSFDIGGGSTEFTAIDKGEIVLLQSLKLGIRSLSNKYHSNPNSIKQAVKLILTDLNPQFLNSKNLIGIGGTVANLAAISNRLKHYDSASVHKAKLTLSQLQKYLEQFSIMSLDEIRLLMPFEPQRAEIISIGIMIIIEIMLLFKAEYIMISDHGLMFGEIVRAKPERKEKI